MSCPAGPGNVVADLPVTVQGMGKPVVAGSARAGFLGHHVRTQDCRDVHGAMMVGSRGQRFQHRMTVEHGTRKAAPECSWLKPEEILLNLECLCNLPPFFVTTDRSAIDYCRGLVRTLALHISVNLMPAMVEYVRLFHQLVPQLTVFKIDVCTP